MQRRPSLIGPLILITLGILLLLANQGLLPLTFWELAARYWPLIFILIGLEIIVGRQSAVGALIVLVLWIAVVAGVLWLSFNQSPVAAGITEEISQPLGDIKSATVDLDFGVTRAEVNALDAGATDLMRGSFTHVQGVRLVKTYNTAGNEGRLALKEDGVTFMMNGATTSRWVLGLNPQIPIGLRVNGGVGSAKIDLSALNVPSLNIDTGVGSLSITMPQTGVTSARVNGGLGGLLIVIPQNVAARIRVDQGIGNTRVDQTRFPKAGDVYQSADYATAQNRVDITIDGGLGNINIQ